MLFSNYFEIFSSRGGNQLTVGFCVLRNHAENFTLDFVYFSIKNLN